jgi:L-ascorbate metabolism protein UlaG (beta-lactamase superfamily)
MRKQLLAAVLATAIGAFAAPLAVAQAKKSPPAKASAAKVEVLWLGQAAFRITSPGGKNIMIDPWILTNPKTPQEWKDLAKLGKLDTILVTHAHLDHFGDSVALAKQNKVPMWGPAGLADTLISLGIATNEEAPRMNKGGTITPTGPGITISQVHADHSSDFVYVNPDTKKRETYNGGAPVGVIVKLENGFTIYHMGDTNLFGDMALIGRMYKPDLLLIPIGGHFVMDPRLAAEATRMVKPKIAIPMHYGTIPLLRGTPEEYIKALGKTSTKVMVMQPGDKLAF